MCQGEDVFGRKAVLPFEKKYRIYFKQVLPRLPLKTSVDWKSQCIDLVLLDISKHNMEIIILLNTMISTCIQTLI